MVEGGDGVGDGGAVLDEVEVGVVGAETVGGGGAAVVGGVGRGRLAGVGGVLGFVSPGYFQS